ncbi:MAG: RHS repeat-associated core domain-containing protein, partial [Anaerolineae bacterium]
GGATTVYIGNTFEWTGSTATMKKYYYAGAVRVAMRTGVSPGTVNYLLSDHLGSQALTLTSAGARLNTNTELRYMPYGAARYTAGTTPTSYNFTGQRKDGGSGLLFYNARWYDPAVGRFLQADTIVPSPQNPQNLNRYSYCGSNPLRFIDPSGHAGVDFWGGGGAGAGIGLVVALVQGAQQTMTQVQGAVYQYGPIAAETIRLYGNQTIAAGDQLAQAAQNASQAGNTAGSSGLDPNDPRFKQVTEQAGQTTQSVWKLDPLKRGQEIEKMLGRSPQLTQNFPVIDRFENGVATSIKSIDLGAKSYQNMGTLTSTVKGYVNELANWQGVRSWGNFGVGPNDITLRELLLAIPTGATEAQMAALRALQQWANTVGVNVNITVIP